MGDAAEVTMVPNGVGERTQPPNEHAQPVASADASGATEGAALTDETFATRLAEGKEKERLGEFEEAANIFGEILEFMYVHRSSRATRAVMRCLVLGAPRMQDAKARGDCARNCRNVLLVWRFSAFGAPTLKIALLAAFSSKGYAQSFESKPSDVLGDNIPQEAQKGESSSSLEGKRNPLLCLADLQHALRVRARSSVQPTALQPSQRATARMRVTTTTTTTTRMSKAVVAGPNKRRISRHLTSLSRCLAHEHCSTGHFGSMP